MVWTRCSACGGCRLLFADGVFMGRRWIFRLATCSLVKTVTLFILLLSMAEAQACCVRRGCAVGHGCRARRGCFARHGCPVTHACPAAGFCPAAHLYSFKHINGPEGESMGFLLWLFSIFYDNMGVSRGETLDTLSIESIKAGLLTASFPSYRSLYNSDMTKKNRKETGQSRGSWRRYLQK